MTSVSGLRNNMLLHPLLNILFRMIKTFDLYWTQGPLSFIWYTRSNSTRVLDETRVEPSERVGNGFPVGQLVSRLYFLLNLWSKGRRGSGQRVPQVS